MENPAMTYKLDRRTGYFHPRRVRAESRPESLGGILKAE